MSRYSFLLHFVECEKCRDNPYALCPDGAAAAADDSTKSGPIWIESTPRPGETNVFERRFRDIEDNKKYAPPAMGSLVKEEPFSLPFARVPGSRTPAGPNEPLIFKERCSGCGKTPCIPDARGCCPNRPEEEPDLSWGDYEPEEP